MATSASQTYISKLGFQDKDRTNERHGLACEYLFERLLEMEVAPYLNECREDYLRHDVERCETALEQVNNRLVDAKNRLARIEDKWVQEEISRFERESGEAYDRLHVAIQGLAAFSPAYGINEARRRLKAAYSINQPIKQPGRSFVVGFADVRIEVDCKHLLGEVKITPQSAESILQQINFYEAHLRGEITTYILTDFDCSDLQRMVEGTHIKVFRLGRRFEQWLASRTAFQSNEL